MIGLTYDNSGEADYIQFHMAKGCLPPAPAKVACKYGVANVYKVRNENVGPIWRQS